MNATSLAIKLRKAQKELVDYKLATSVYRDLMQQMLVVLESYYQAGELTDSEMVLCDEVAKLLGN